MAQLERSACAIRVQCFTPDPSDGHHYAEDGDFYADCWELGGEPC
jgi:hypothetical protein